MTMKKVQIGMKEMVGTLSKLRFRQNHHKTRKSSVCSNVTCETDSSEINDDCESRLSGALFASFLSDGSTSNKRVSFGNLYIRVYPIILGDHPDCSEGPPITLGWDYHEESIIKPVHEWESEREPRRSSDELVTGWKYRAKLLKEVASTEEMISAMKTVDEIKKKRQQTIRRQKFEFWEESAQALCGKFRHLKKDEPRQRR